MHPAIFFDRDGTLIEDRGYIKSVSDIVFFTETINALSMLQKHFYLFVITNQSGIAKGITSIGEVKNVNNYMLGHFIEKGINIKALYCCPHETSDQCNCKKPSPYFIFEAMKEYNIKLEGSYIIGDHPSDVMCGINAKINPVYVLTGHGEKHRHELELPVPVVNNIGEAAAYILKQRTINLA